MACCNEKDDLLDRISGGDEVAFRTLFDMHYQRLFHVALYYLKTTELAEEAVCDVFFIIWQRRDRMHKIHDIERYLYTSVRNQALHYIRRSRRPAQKPLDLYTVEIIPDADDPHSKLIDSEYRETVQRAIDSLPGQCREVFRLTLSDKLKQREIASLLSISIKTVEAHISTARKRIAAYVTSSL